MTNRSGEHSTARGQRRDEHDREEPRHDRGDREMDSRRSTAQPPVSEEGHLDEERAA